MFKVYKCWLIVCILFISNMSIHSQQTDIDSLMNIVETSAKDTALVTTLHTLSLKLLSTQKMPESLEYGKRAVDLANELNYDKGKAYALKNLGIYYYYQGDYLEVFDHWSKSLQTFEVIQDTLGMSNMLNNLGGMYLSQGSNDKALEYFLKSLSYAEKLKNPLRITSVLPNIGGVYGDIKEYDKALSYFNQMEPYLESLNDPQITTFYLMGIGEVYRRTKKYDEALKYYNAALPINKDNDNYAHILTMIGTIESHNGNIKNAIDNLNLGYNTAKDRGQQWEIIQSLKALGDVYQKDDFKKALENYQKAELLAKETAPNKDLRDIYMGLSKTYAFKGDYSKAFDYQEQYLVQKDSLFNLETNDKIRGLQFDYDLDKKQDEIALLERKAEITELQQKRQKSALITLILTSAIVLMLAIGLYRRYKFIAKTNIVINDEKNRAEDLLLNILPYETAKELQQNGKVKAKRSESVTVMFTDFKSFTQHSENLTPEALVKSVDFFFSRFDTIVEKYGLEKIKTIGDAYMCAGGLPFPLKDHAIKVINAAFEILEVMEEAKLVEDDDISHFDIRIGINTGPVVAGVVGIKKFAYDIWGDTVNIASRMESASTSGRINISANTYELIKDHFICKYRGEIEVKNKGIMKMYFVNAKKDLNESKSLEKAV